MGRSWNVANSINSKNLAIGFIGDYENHDTNYEQLTALINLLEYGIIRGYIKEDYKLVAKNQVIIIISYY